MASLLAASSQECVLIRDTNGIVAIPRSSPLTRLHYFDGKFLRAEHMRQEQDYQRRLVEVSNQAGGAGVVYGLDCTLTGDDQLEVGSGLAIDPQGQVILLPQNQRLSLTELIARSRLQLAPEPTGIGTAQATFDVCELRAQAKPGIVQESTDFYLITVGHAEAYCGTEDVYGKLCEEACVTSTSRPYVIEGVVFRAEPMPELRALLPTPRTLNLATVHLRSRVASAYFRRDEQGINAAVAPPVLTTGVSCLGAHLPGGENVPIALVARQGSTTLFLDAWIARRERMEAPARTYWAGCLRLRPWHVFLAQVLQFQCHLNALFPGGKESTVVRDPRREIQDRIVSALGGLINKYPKVVESLNVAFPQEALLPELKDMQTIVSNLQALKPAAFGSTDQVLIQGGIIELPSAGYLPVDAKSTRTVNEQVRRLLGGGVDLRFCVVRPGYIPHALEEAQHMERISLVQGLDNPEDKPEVDVLVPTGTIRKCEAVPRGTGFAGDVTIKMEGKTAGIHGAGRAEERDAGGLEFCFSGTGTVASSSPNRLATVVGELGSVASAVAGGRVADAGIAFVASAAASAQPATRAATLTAVQPTLSVSTPTPVRLVDAGPQPATRAAAFTAAQPTLSVSTPTPVRIAEAGPRPAARTPVVTPAQPVLNMSVPTPARTADAGPQPVTRTPTVPTAQPTPSVSAPTPVRIVSPDLQPVARTPTVTTAPPTPSVSAPTPAPTVNPDLQPVTRTPTVTTAPPTPSVSAPTPAPIVNPDLQPVTRIPTVTTAQPAPTLAPIMNPDFQPAAPTPTVVTMAQPIAGVPLPTLPQITDVDLRPVLSKLGLTLALWFELRFDRNPFALAKGDTTEAYLRWLWTWPGAEAGSVQLQEKEFAATLLIDSVTESTVTGGLNTGKLRVESIRPVAVAAPAGLLSLFRSFTISREMGKDGLVYTLKLPHLGLTLSANVTAAEKGGKAVFAPSGGSTTEFEAKLRADPAVFSAEHSAHKAALEALRKLGLELEGEPDFVDMATRRLFPPPLPQTTELQVLATQDWVLFHRRRQKECEVETVVPVLPPARTYRVFLARTDDEGLKQITNALRIGDVTGLTETVFASIDGVTFAPGAAELASPAQDIQTRWSQALPGNKLLYGAIASTAAAAAEGDPLASGRLRTLVQVLPPVTTLESATLKVLEQVPKVLDPQDKDGVCILVTNKTTCLSVRGVTSIEELEQMVTPIQTGDWDAALKASEPIGDVAFWGEGSQESDVARDSLKPVVTEWVRRYGQSGAAKGYSVSSQTPGTGQADVDLERANLVGTRLNVKEGVEAVATRAEFPKAIPCRAVVFFAPSSTVPEPAATTCMSVYPVNADAMLKLQTAIDQAAGSLSQIVDALTPLVQQPPIGAVEFDENNGAVTGSLEELAKEWAVPTIGVGDTVVVSKEREHAADDQRRAVAIYRGLGGQAGDVGAPIVIGPMEEIPCRAALIAVRLALRAVRVFVRDTAPDGTARLVPVEAPVTLRSDGTLEAGFVETVRGPLEGREVTEIVVAPRETGIDPQVRERAMNGVAEVLAEEELIPDGQEVRADMRELTALERELLPADINATDEVIVLRTRKRQ